MPSALLSALKRGRFCIRLQREGLKKKGLLLKTETNMFLLRFRFIVRPRDAQSLCTGYATIYNEQLACSQFYSSLTFLCPHIILKKVTAQQQRLSINIHFRNLTVDSHKAKNVRGQGFFRNYSTSNQPKRNIINIQIHKYKS